MTTADFHRTELDAAYTAWQQAHGTLRCVERDYSARCASSADLQAAHRAEGEARDLLEFHRSRHWYGRRAG